MLILALNVGSSSIKSAVFDASAGVERLVFAAAVTTQTDHLLGVVSLSDGAPQKERILGTDDHRAITGCLHAWSARDSPDA